MFDYQELRILFGVRNLKTNCQLQKEFSQHFFYPNVCQYCSNFGPEVSTKRCNNCHAMFYCSAEHSKNHWKEHKEFCGVLANLRITENKQCLFENGVAKNLAKQCRLIELAEAKLGRKLQPYEHNMLMFPRVCLDCDESNPGVVKSCPKCPQGNFCTKHQDSPLHNKVNCSLYHLVLHLDQHWIVFKDLPWKQFVHYNLPHNKKNVGLPETIIQFIEKYVTPYQERINLEDYDVQTLVSTVYTRALTLVYALQKLRLTLCSQLVIHVMSKRKYVLPFVKEHFVEWEILLHWFPRLKFLKICFIGCEMQSNNYSFPVCADCKSKTLKIETSKLLYKKYYTINRRNPDVIIAYNVDIINQYTWVNAKSLLTSLNTPIVLTGMCKANINRAATACVENANNFSRIELNPFHSMRLERFEKDFSFSNKFISIYADNLVPKICGVNNPIEPCNTCYDCLQREPTEEEIHQIRTHLDDVTEYNEGLKKQLQLCKEGLTIMRDWKTDYRRYFGNPSHSSFERPFFDLDILEVKVATLVTGLELAEDIKMTKDMFSSRRVTSV